MRLTILLINIFLVTKVYSQTQFTNYTYDGVSNRAPNGFIQFNDRIYFSATTDGLGTEIWSSDGTISNTALLKDINPGNEKGLPNGLGERTAILNNELYFIGSNGTSNGEIWKTNGTNSGTIQVTNFLNGRVNRITAVGNNIFFLIESDLSIYQVWKTDGSTDGAVLVKDQIPNWNRPTFQGKSNNNFIFTIQPIGSNNIRLWRSNGTSEGTFPITDEIDGNGSGEGGTSALSQYIEFNNKLYFVSRYHLHETDGTLENTRIVAPVFEASNNLIEYSDVIEINNKLYFSFFSSDTYRLEIWESDGTTANTLKVYDNFSNKYFFTSNLSSSDNSLIFCGSNQTGGTSLISLNLTSYVASDLAELSETFEKPVVLTSFIDVSNIYKISDDEFFIKTPHDEYAGWISNIQKNSTTLINSLSHVGSAIGYNQELYYSKDLQLWKHTESVLGTNTFEKESLLSISPNPSSDVINIIAKSKVESVEIYDLFGKLLISLPELNKNEINISELKAGTYIVQSRLNRTLITNKIIKN